MAIYALPLLFALQTSLKTPMDYLRNPLGLSRLFPANFVQAWEKARLGVYLANSLLYVVMCTAISLAGAFSIAFPVARGYVRHRIALSALMLLGLFLPDGTIPLFQIMLRVGLYNTRTGYMLAMLAIGGINFAFLVAYIKGLPRELDEAAIMDGCGYLRYLVFVAAPLCKPARHLFRCSRQSGYGTTSPRPSFCFRTRASTRSPRGSTFFRANTPPTGLS